MTHTGVCPGGLTLCIFSWHHLSIHHDLLSEVLIYAIFCTLISEHHIREELRDSKRSGKGSFGIQSPEYQELSATAAAAPLITLKSSETQNVDLTDKVRANHYLRHFEHRSALHVMNRTGSFRYMSDKTSEGVQFQGYMLECVCRKETQRIRTATNFLRRSTVPSEDVFSSSVTNVPDSRASVPNITWSSKDRREDTFSVDHRREMHGCLMRT